MKNASFHTIVEDLKVSFKFALRNLISYILALLGVIIISAILLVLVAAMIFIPLFFVSGGLEGLIALFTSFGTMTEAGFTNIAVGGLLIALPLVAPFFVAIGAMFGMGREIVESEGTSIEGVFTWYRRKFFSLAGGGIVLFLVVLGPLILILLAGSVIFGVEFFGFMIIGASPASYMYPVIGALLTIWFVVSTGLLSMLFPAIIDGHSVLDATRKSIKMSIQYFDRVFGVWIAFMAILGACLLPLTGFPWVLAAPWPWIALLSVLAIPAILILIFVYLPALTIGLTRVYMILTADDDEETTPQEDGTGPNFIGGL